MSMSPRAQELHRSARQQAMVKGLMSKETITVVIISAILVVLCTLNLFWFPQAWWLWVILGCAGAIALAFSAASDKSLVRRFVSEGLDKKIDATKVRIPELQANVARAMFQHRSISKLIHERPENLGTVIESLDEWALMIYDVARGLDDVLNDPRVVQQYQQVLGVADPAEAMRDPMSAVVNAGALVVRHNPAHQLVLARDVVTQVRAEMNMALERIVNINTALRKARALKLESEHVQQIESALQLQLVVLGEAQDAVYQLGYAYELAPGT